MKFQIKLYLTGQSLILLHHFLILLVDTKHLTDPVGSRLCLRAKGMSTLKYNKQSNTVPMIDLRIMSKSN